MKLTSKFILTCVLLLTCYIAAKTIDIKQLLFKDDKVKCALFTSQHNIVHVLVELINSEKKSIKAAMYMLTHNDIARALIRAKRERNLEIEIITGKDGYENTFSKFQDLEKHRIPVYIFGNNKTEALMHNKFIIFEDNIDGKSLVWTGSFNCTKNAQNNNKENVLILDDQHIIDQYKKEFAIIQKESRLAESKINTRKKARKTKSRSNFLGSKEEFLKTSQIHA